MIKTITWFFACFCAFTAYANEKSLYDFSWLDNDKEIYVLQNRRYRKDGKFYLGGNMVKTVNGAFVDSYGGTLRGGYFFRENWGVEFLFGKNKGDENDTAKGVKEQGTFPFYRKIDSTMGALLMWSPFYAKINTFDRVFYFDWLFGLGLANVKTLDNSKKFDAIPSSTMTSENNKALIWNTGFRFHLNDHWSVRLDYSGTHFKADRTRRVGGAKKETSTLFSSYDFGVGLNYAF